MNLIKSQCDSLKKRIVELEYYENTYRNVERELEKVKHELKEKDGYYAEEMKKFEMENKSFNELNAGYTHLNETMLTMSRKYEQDLHNFDSKLKNMQNLLDKKDVEVNELKRSKDQEITSFINKLSAANDDNLNLTNQLKNIGINLNNKDEDLNKMRKRFNDLSVEHEKLKHIELDLVTMTNKSLTASARAQDLEARLEETERKYHRDLNAYYQQQEEIKQLKQEIKNDSIKFEKLHADYEYARLELNKMELSKMKADQLEREMNEIKNTKLLKLSELETHNKKYSETIEKFENEIKLLNAQMLNLVIYF